MTDPAASGQTVSDSEAIPYVICGLNDIPSRRARGFKLVILDENGQEKPLSIIIVRWGKQVFGYLNKCPHDGVNLDWERNQFLDPNGLRLMCGKHGATFEIGTGNCMEGPCLGDSLTPVAVTVIDNDICILGLRLAEDEDEDEEEAETT
jgi:nitrite reductase/ring-hydroxylating ferredoxin subunit